MFKKQARPVKINYGSPPKSELIPTQAYVSSDDELDDVLMMRSVSSSIDSSSSSSSSSDDEQQPIVVERPPTQRRRADQMNDGDSDANQRPTKKGMLAMLMTRGSESEENDSNDAFIFALPTRAPQAPQVPQPPIYSRVVTTDVAIVTTSQKSASISEYIDSRRRMQLGSLWSLTEVDARYPLIKQRGPYGDGLVLHNAIFKVDHLVANDNGDVAHIVLVEHRTDTKYLLDDRFFEDWSYVRNVDLEKMLGPTHNQFFV